MCGPPTHGVAVRACIKGVKNRHPPRLGHLDPPDPAIHVAVSLHGTHSAQRARDPDGYPGPPHM